MSGYALLFADCVSCRRTFTCNPNRVPSLRINAQGQPDATMPRQPLCERCYTRLQQVRKDAGLEPWPEPLPGAYEACPEEEL